MTVRNMTFIQFIIFSIYCQIISAWVITIEVGILHSWWHLIPVMAIGTALVLTSVACVTAGLLTLAKILLS
jgi:hypothetical protein